MPHSGTASREQEREDQHTSAQEVPEARAKTSVTVYWLKVAFQGKETRQNNILSITTFLGLTYARRVICRVCGTNPSVLSRTLNAGSSAFSWIFIIVNQVT